MEMPNRRLGQEVYGSEVRLRLEAEVLDDRYTASRVEGLVLGSIDSIQGPDIMLSSSFVAGNRSNQDMQLSCSP